jgi:hypothetical protein
MVYNRTSSQSEIQTRDIAPLFNVANSKQEF